jgi:DNA-binding transcriptional ArsR family regulator
LTLNIHSHILHHMVNYQTQNLNRVFSALADPTRRGIISELAFGERTVGELSKPYKISAPAISKHLAVLEDIELIITRKEGRYVICRLQPQTLRNATKWLERYKKFWEYQFINLGKHLNK